MPRNQQFVPAHIDQLNRAQTADDWQIVPDYNQIVKDLQTIDKGLNVRFSRKGQCWAVYHRSHDACPHNGTVPAGGTAEYLIRTMPATLSRLGVWTGLDERVVTRMLQIMPDSRWGYDLADEIEQARRRREERQRKEFQETVQSRGEELAAAIRKDLGMGAYRGRIFKSREIGGAK